MEYYLVLSTIMMFVGIYGFVTRRNLLAMLISVELILNSVDINFVVFNRFLFPEQLEGFFFTLDAINGFQVAAFRLAPRKFSTVPLPDAPGSNLKISMAATSTPNTIYLFEYFIHPLRRYPLRSALVASAP